MSNTVSFNIYDKVRIKVYAKKSQNRVLKRLRVEYSFFETEDLSEADIIVRIGKINKLSSDYVKIDGKYLIGDDWIYLFDSYKVAKWSLYIQFNSDCISLTVDPNFFACDLIPPIILTPLIGFWLNKKGLSLVHAAGIGFEDEAVLITGFGGSGKTSVTLRILEKGLKIFGDDHVILEDGKVLAFPTALSLFSYNIPVESEWIKRYKIKLRLNSLIHKFTFGYIYPVTKAQIDPRLVKNCGKLEKVILIEPSNREECNIEEIEKRELVESWIRNILYDSIYLNKYLCAFSYVNSAFLNYFHDLKETLLRNLASCRQFIRITFPQNNVEKLFETVLHVIEYEGCKL
jgi:hypothetical protein